MIHELEIAELLIWLLYGFTGYCIKVLEERLSELPKVTQLVCGRT